MPEGNSRARSITDIDGKTSTKDRRSLLKTNHLLKAVLIAALVIPATTSSYAGPGPQFWSRQAASAKERGDRAGRTPPAASMACPSCRTRTAVEPVYGYFPGGETDDYRIEWIPVGKLHVCNACGGEIGSVRGKTTRHMPANCPICTKAVPTCCKVAG